VLRVTTFSTLVSENSALGAKHGVGEHVALVVEVSLAPLRLSTDYSPLLPKQSKIASLGRRLHRVGHRNETIGNQTRWLTPAGLCVSTQQIQRDRELANFSRRQTPGLAW